MLPIHYKHFQIDKNTPKQYRIFCPVEIHIGKKGGNYAS